MPQLVYNYGNWQFWETYNPPTSFGPQKVTFDGPNRLILVNAGVSELNFKEDVYSNWKEWVMDPTQTNSKWAEAISGVGGDDLPGDRVLGATFFLENGWRMRTWEGNHELTVTGNAFTREGEDIFVPTLKKWNITIRLNTSTLVEVILPTPLLTSADITSIVNETTTALDPTFQAQNRAAYDAIYVDLVAGNSGTEFPCGTASKPVNNLTDARALATSFGVKHFKLLAGTATLTSDVSNEIWEGVGQAAVNLSSCISSSAQFKNLEVSGTIAASAAPQVFQNCTVRDLSGVCGDFIGCLLDGTMTLASIGVRTLTTFKDCATKDIDTNKATLDFNNQEITVSARAYAGALALVNISNSSSDASIDLDVGKIELDASDSDGYVVLRGTGTLVKSGVVGTSITKKGFIEPSKLLTVAKFIGLK